MQLIKELATKVVKEELHVVKKDYLDAEYTIYVKPEEINDLTRWQHDLAQRRLKVTIEDGIHQVTGDSASIVTLMMNQGMSEKEVTRRFDDQAGEQFKRDRHYVDFEDSDESSDYSDRRRNRLHRHKERMRPAFGIKGVSEETIKESGKRSGFLTTFDVDSFDMTNFREEDLIAILENSGYTDNTDIVGAEFVKVGNKNFIYKIQFTDSDGGVDSGNIFISVDQTGKLKAEF